ncbi:MAG: PTS sugar transporter subunit IIC [Clostridiales bacterium]|jgi:PTS system mannose-specific IIC component|nr:PTS sugar transporter subunit IIC [Clostridiales bacterium]
MEFQLSIITIILLACLNGLGIVFLSLAIGGIMNPLVFGTLAGIIIGDPALGLSVGGTCALMSLGFYTYGGATIPDYNVGAIFGVVIAKMTGDIQQGILIGSIVALLMSWFDILGRMTTTVFQHMGDRALANKNIAAFERSHLLGTTTWFLGRFIPVFVGLLLIDNYMVIDAFIKQYAFVQNGLRTIGGVLPAVGFALLISYQDIKKYWPFMVLGYCLFAYMGVPTIGLALVGVACGAIFIMYKGKNEGEVA